MRKEKPVSDTISRETVLDALRSVQDPHFSKDLVTLDFVKDIAVEGKNVRVELLFATPSFPSRENLREECVDKIRALGAESVEVEINTELLGYRPPDRAEVLKGIRNVFTVASGKGGVGKSTVSTNLALALARTGARVGLLDADVYGPSMGIMLGVDDRPEVTPNNTMKPIEAHGMKVMSMSFLTTKDTPVIWRGPMVHGLVSQFLTQVEWGDLDYLVIDLPPGTGDAQLTLTQTAPLAGSVIVTTPQDVSLADARKGLKMFEQVNVPVLGILENMSYFLCPHCDKRTNIFGHGGGRSTSQELEIPFLGEVPIDPEVVAGGDEGNPIVVKNPDSPAARAYSDAAEKVAAALGRLAMKGKDQSSFNIKW